MQTSKRNLLMAAAASLLTFAGKAFSHGDQRHPNKPSLAKKEQKDWGIAGDAKFVKRTIAIGMADTMRFTPNRITVKRGDTVRFTVKNKGQVMHEFVIGTKAENEKHAELMVKFPTMEHDEPYMAHVPPAQSGQIIWQFNRAGTFEFACLIAGHYQSGMVGTIIVRA